MPTTSPPDGSEVFTGETLEEAMAAAVAAHGPDLVVEHARRVRSGVRGLLGKEHYEVVVAAVPATASHAGGDPVEAALAALLEDADEKEAYPVRAPARPAAPAPRREPAPEVTRVRRDAEPARRPPAPPRPAPETARRAPARPAPEAPRPAPEAPRRSSEPRPAAELPRRAAEPPRRTGAPPSVPPVSDSAAGRARIPKIVLEGVMLPPAVRSSAPSPAPAASRAKAPVRKPRKPPAPHPDLSVAEHTTVAGPSWSRATLKRLGVPARVLAALPATDPVDDLSWLVGLTNAIASCVPSPGRVSAATPVVVDGHELAGAVAILEMCSRGAVPGSLTTGGRTVPATATELALLVRTHVVTG